MSKQPNIRDFNNRFPDDAACLEHLMRVRYGERHDCRKCGKSARFYRAKKRTSYACEHCGHQVYPMAGTPFENTRTPLKSWFYAMFLFCASRNGVSAKELERQLGVTYKTAWRMARLIRAYMTEIDGDAPLGGPSGGIVEADKAFIGGKDERGKDDKTVVLGMVERGGEVITKIVPHRGSNAVIPQIAKWVKPGSRIATDTAKAFGELREFGYKHGQINHSAKEYVRGPVHTNTIEGFWNIFKRGVKGTYIWCSPKHLQVYLGEFEYRWNLRHAPQLMFEILMQAFSRPGADLSPSAREVG